MRVTLQTMGVLPPTEVLSVQRWEPGLSVGAVEGGQKKRLSWGGQSGRSSREPRAKTFIEPWMFKSQRESFLRGR